MMNNHWLNNPNTEFPRKQFERFNDMWAEDYAICEGFLATAKCVSMLPNSLIHHRWDDDGHLVLTLEIQEVDDIRQLIEAEEYDTKTEKSIIGALRGMIADHHMIVEDFSKTKFELMKAQDEVERHKVRTKQVVTFILEHMLDVEGEADLILYLFDRKD